jgi:hypothetical protein
MCLFIVCCGKHLPYTTANFMPFGVLTRKMFANGCKLFVNGILPTDFEVLYGAVIGRHVKKQI